jgi:hypothetical protein
MKKLIIPALMFAAPVFAQEPAPVALPAATVPATSDIAEQIHLPRDPWYRGWTIGVSGGALTGVSGELGYRIPYNPNNFWKNRLGFRLNYNTISPIWNSFEKDVNKEGQKLLDDGTDLDIEGLTISNAQFEADVKGRQFGALVDFHPFGYTWGLGGLRLSAGYYFGDLEISGAVLGADLAATQSFETTMNAGGYDLPVKMDIAADILDNDMRMGLKLNASGPYVGLGWDVSILPFIDGLHLTFDAGVVISNAHKVELDIPEIKLPDNAEVKVDLSEAYAQNQAQFNALITDLQSKGYCNAPGMPPCPTSSDLVLEVPQSMVEDFRNDYANTIADFNNKVQKEKEDALWNTDTTGGKDKGVNEQLKDYPYFPIVRLGLMWRF